MNDGEGGLEASAVVLPQLIGDRRRWWKSSFSNGQCACLEISVSPEGVQVRDSKYLRDPSNKPEAQPVISVAHTVWETFVAEVCGGPVSNSALATTFVIDGSVRLTSQIDGTMLVFTSDEWSAFVDGALAREFDRLETLV
jgi:hypothetical protein